MEEVVLVRFGELFLKSDPVRRRFMQVLGRNCTAALDAAEIDHRLEMHRDRILIHTRNPADAVQRVARVFGVVDASVCTLTDPTLPACGEAAVDLARHRLEPGMTFAVRARRRQVSGFSSQELAAAVGAAIRDAIPGAAVDLDDPGYEVFVEARPFGGLVYDTRIPGPGGLPLGTQGPVLSLLSAGIDSPVASWLVMHRGCPVVHLTFDAGRFQGEDVEGAVLRNHASLSRWCPGMQLDLLVADAEPFFDVLAQEITPRFRCVVCKRFMVRAGSMIARDEGVLALVTGENLGQVASQTLDNLAVIDRAATAPLLRPLITWDKNETVDIARRIGTFEKDPGDLGCRAVPVRPATAATREAVEREEGKVDMEGLIRDLCRSIRRVRARDGGIIGP
ncbi:MAG: tRNA uracil 4-sulfurtransferase ThiI [Methanomicrobiales archaeon]